MLEYRRFCAWASIRFRAAICVAIVCNCIAFSNSVSADRIGMAASRFLAAAAACVILLCFAAEGPKSHCNVCMKVANGALATVVLFFFIFGC